MQTMKMPPPAARGAGAGQGGRAGLASHALLQAGFDERIQIAIQHFLRIN